MGITLEKKQTISLEKNGGGQLTKISMGLGWDAAKRGGLLGMISGGGGDIDLDASCIVLDRNKNCLDVVWFGQLTSKDGHIKHSGDNRTGDGDGDDETIYVDLASLGSNAQYLVFTVNSFTGQTFDRVKNAYCRIVDNSNCELARFNLSEQGSHTGLIMAYLKRSNGGWTVTAVGEKASGRSVQDLARQAMSVVGA